MIFRANARKFEFLLQFSSISTKSLPFPRRCAVISAKQKGSSTPCCAPHPLRRRAPKAPLKGELARRSRDLGETPNAQRLAKLNPCSAEGLMQRKKSLQSSTRLLQAFKNQVCEIFQANVYQTNELAPSGGPILSSAAKKESGKKDAA